MDNYKPWAFQDRSVARAKTVEDFEQDANASAAQSAQDGWNAPDPSQSLYGGNVAQALDASLAGANLPTARQSPPAQKGGGGWLDKLTAPFSDARDTLSDVRDTASDILHLRNPGGDALSALGDATSAIGSAIDIPREFGGKQALGVLTGAAGMKRVPIYGPGGEIVGYKREGGQGFGSWLGNVGESLEHPVRAGEAYDDYSASLPWLGRAAAGTVSNPLSFVGGGAEVAGITAAQAALDQYGKDIPGWNKLPPEVQQAIVLAGGALAGHLGKKAPAAYKAALGPEGSLVQGLAKLQGREGQTPAFGGMIDLTNEHVGAYEDALIRHGIPYQFDEHGAIEITDPEKAQQVMNDLAEEHAHDLEVLKVQGQAATGNFQGDVQHIYSPDGSGSRVAYDPNNPRVRGAHRVEKRYGADSSTYDAVNDVERIGEVLDPDQLHDSSTEQLRQPWAEGAALPGVENPTPEAIKALADERDRLQAGNRGNANDTKAAAAALGQARADAFLSSRVGPGYSPSSTLMEIAGEIDNVETFNAYNKAAVKAEQGVGALGKRESILPVPERAYVERLRQAYEHIVENGHDAVHTELSGPETAGVPDHGAPALGEPSGADRLPPAGEGAASAAAGEGAGTAAPGAAEGLIPPPQPSGNPGQLPTARPLVLQGQTPGAPPPPIPPVQGRLGQGAPSGAPGGPPAPGGPGWGPPASPGGWGKAPSPRWAGKDLFDTVPQGQLAANEASYLGTFKGKVDQLARKVASYIPGVSSDKNFIKDTDVRPLVVAERTRLKNLTDSYEGMADHLWGQVADSGVKVERNAGGDWVIQGTSVPFGDMVEQSTPQGAAAYANLSPAQRAAVDGLKGFNDQLNGNLLFHGNALPFDPAVGSAYFPRMVTGINGAERATIGDAGGAPMGAGGSFMRERTQASLDDGTANGIDYAHPNQAYRAMVRAKLRVAADSYIADGLRPLGQTATQLTMAGEHAGFNYVALPTDIAPSLNGLYFPRETAERIVGALDGKPGFSIPGVKALNAALTPLKIVGDLGWFARQGQALLFRHPLQATAGALRVIRSATGDPEQYRTLIDNEAARGPGLQFLISKGLHWVPDELGETDAGFSPGVQNLPVVGRVAKFTNESYGRYLNYARLVLGNDAAEIAQRSGRMDELRGAMSAVNRMTGFSGRKPTSLESMFEFAPRFFSATVEQTAAALSKGDLEGQLAREHIGRMLGTGALMVVGANAVRGYNTDFDPRSPNFLRVRNLGGLDVSPFGTFDTLFRAIAATAAGPSGQPMHPDIKRLWHLAEGKMSPAISAVYQPFIKGSTYNGEPLDPLGSWAGAARAAYEQGKSSLPFAAENVVQQSIEPAVRQRDPSKLLDAIPGTVASAVALTNSPMTPSEKLDLARQGTAGDQGPLSLGPGRFGLPSKTGLAQEQFGKSYDDLPGAEKAALNRNPEVQQLQADVDRNTLSRDDDRSKNLEVTQVAQQKIDALSKELESGAISGDKFRDQYSTIEAELRGARNVLKINGKQDPTLDGWFGLYDKAAGADGTIDNAKLTILQDAYRAVRPDVDEKLDIALGTHDNPTVAQLRQARPIAAAYFSIPEYQGLTTEQSQKALTLIRAARAMVAYRQAPDENIALMMLGAKDPAGYGYAMMAKQLGPNPMRQFFRYNPATGPLLERFYSAALAAGEDPGSPAESAA